MAKELLHYVWVKMWGGLVIVLTLGHLVHAEDDIRIIYFSNMPEVSETDERPGLARVAAYINQARDKNDNSFVIHGGDSLSPAVLSSLDRGAHMIDILNIVEPDVFAIAKREFAYGEDMLIQRAVEALFPFVSSNTVDLRTNRPFNTVSPGELFTVNGISIGIVALTSPAVLTDYGVKRTSVLDPFKSAVEQSKRLREQGADLIIVTADFDVRGFNEMFSSGTFDLVIETSFDKTVSHKVGDAFYVRSIADGRQILDMTVSIDQEDERYVISDVRTVIPDLKQYEPDEDVLSAIDLHLAPLEELLNMPIGTVASELTTDRAMLRSEENAFANLLADSLRLKVGADVALINGGSIRGDRDYSVGYKLTRRDMQAELPFRNTIALLEVTGQQIWDAVEHGIPCRQDYDGCFPQVSNLEIRYSLSKGKAVSVSLNGEPIDKSKLYKLATTDYLSGGGDGYEMLASAKKLEISEGGQLTREVLSQYVIDKGSINSVIENRIVLEP
ncbi:bifunctional UDP-sugar hydrolase/5'-nucleotidase [Kordiimonas sp. SCSIO 12610]|uniref:bifunctional metallophosphatase/5'-nucleotidase n=1 Tax=Kordiimonas sp. SCSIO 12610 TaxID=2829597 RepID=UPI00210CA9A3|nr:5'-nucleotidase C-terminal domain-containing protein [Kordiimonas sp. SCSIO 12610]UTW55917.1 5'-nucleotidase C-terminal domain-containing protein [Kordiimonas sp. SCSIO 12610]